MAIKIEIVGMPKEHNGDRRSDECLASAVTQLAHSIFELGRQLQNQTALCRVEQKVDNIMSAISDWNAKVGPKLDRVQTGLDALQALVEQLQNSPGAITPEDQALLDQIEAKVDAIAGDAEGLPTPPPA